MIKIFSTVNCTYCKQLKKYFDKKGIEYKEVDVTNDKKAQNELIELSGQFGVPFTMIGKKKILGYNISEINKALEFE